jgi:2-dehydropantoate 2-reductase
MRFILYGAGGVGGTIGAELFRAGEDVILIARGAHLDVIQKNGLRYETPHYQELLSIAAVGHPNEIDFRDGDVVILSMKAQHTLGALEDLRAAAGDTVPVICCQNGVANEAMASRRFRHVYAMAVYLPGESLEPGVIRCHSENKIGILDAGVYPSGVDDLITRVAESLEAANIVSVPTADTMAWKYTKLVINTSNATDAACDPDAETKPLRDQLHAEAFACFDAAGISYRTLTEMRERRGDLMKNGKIDGVGRAGGSSWQSLENGRPDNEVDFLNGEIVQLGRLHGVPTPANTAMQNLMTRMTRDGIAPRSLDMDEINSLIAAEE